MALGDLNEEVVEILKPRNDKRDYRRIVLHNNLQVLLISDAETDKCAASMDVCVGAFRDPEGLEGLAHFLEHMLFYASKKYPQEDSYSKYISELVAAPSHSIPPDNFPTHGAYGGVEASGNLDHLKSDQLSSGCTPQASIVNPMLSNNLDKPAALVMLSRQCSVLEIVTGAGASCLTILSGSPKLERLHLTDEFKGGVLLPYLESSSGGGGRNVEGLFMQYVGPGKE